MAGVNNIHVDSKDQKISNISKECIIKSLAENFIRSIQPKLVDCSTSIEQEHLGKIPTKRKPEEFDEENYLLSRNYTFFEGKMDEKYFAKKEFENIFDDGKTKRPKLVKNSLWRRIVTKINTKKYYFSHIRLVLIANPQDFQIEQKEFLTKIIKMLHNKFSFYEFDVNITDFSFGVHPLTIDDDFFEQVKIQLSSWNDPYCQCIVILFIDDNSGNFLLPQSLPENLFAVHMSHHLQKRILAHRDSLHGLITELDYEKYKNDVNFLKEWYVPTKDCSGRFLQSVKTKMQLNDLTLDQAMDQLERVQKIFKKYHNIDHFRTIAFETYTERLFRIIWEKYIFNAEDVLIFERRNTKIENTLLSYEDSINLKIPSFYGNKFNNKFHRYLHGIIPNKNKHNYPSNKSTHDYVDYINKIILQSYNIFVDKIFGYIKKKSEAIVRNKLNFDVDYWNHVTYFTRNHTKSEFSLSNFEALMSDINNLPKCKCCITGSVNSGKTSLLSKIAFHYLLNYRNINLVFIAAILMSDRSLGKLLELFFLQLAKITYKMETNHREDFTNLLKKHTNKELVYVFIDDADLLEDMSWALELPQNCYLFCTYKNTPNKYDILFSINEDHTLQNHYNCPTKTHTSSCHTLNQTIRFLLPNIDDVVTFRAKLEKCLSVIENHFGFDLVKEICALITIGEGVSEEIINEMCETSKNNSDINRVPDLAFEGILLALEEFYFKFTAYQSDAIYWKNDAVHQFIINRYSFDFKFWWKKLAEYFTKIEFNRNSVPKSALAKIYCEKNIFVKRMDILVKFLKKSHLFNVIKSHYLLDSKFLSTRLHISGIQSVVDDCEYYLKYNQDDWDVNLLKNLLEMSFSVLKCYPNEFSSVVVSYLNNWFVKLSNDDKEKYKGMNKLIKDCKKDTKLCFIPSKKCLPSLDNPHSIPIELKIEAKGIKILSSLNYGVNTEKDSFCFNILEKKVRECELLILLEDGSVMNTNNNNFNIYDQKIKQIYILPPKIIIASGSGFVAFHNIEDNSPIASFTNFSEDVYFSCCPESKTIFAASLFSQEIFMWRVEANCSIKFEGKINLNDPNVSKNEILLAPTTPQDEIIYGIKNSNKINIFNFKLSKTVEFKLPKTINNVDNLIFMKKNTAFSFKKAPENLTYVGLLSREFLNELWSSALLGDIEIIEMKEINGLNKCGILLKSNKIHELTELHIMDCESGIVTRKISSFANLTSFYFISNNEVITIEADNNSLEYWNIPDNAKWNFNNVPRQKGLKFFSHGNEVICADKNDGTIKTYKINEDGTTKKIKVVMNDGEVIYNKGKTIVLKEREYNEEMQMMCYVGVLSGMSLPVHPTSEYKYLSDDLLICPSDSRNHLVVWSLQTGYIINRIRLARKSSVLEEHIETIDSFLLSEDERIVVVSYFANYLHVFKTNQQTETIKLHVDDKTVLSLRNGAISYDGSFILHVGFSNRLSANCIMIWNLNNGELIKIIVNSEPVISSDISKDNSFVAVLCPKLIYFGSINSGTHKFSHLNGFVVDGNSRIHCLGEYRKILVVSRIIFLWCIDKCAVLATFNLCYSLQSYALVNSGRFITLGLDVNEELVILEISDIEKNSNEQQ